MTKERKKILFDSFKYLNLKRELKDTADTIGPGYINRRNADLIGWMCISALERIEELEKLTDERKQTENV